MAGVGSRTIFDGSNVSDDLDALPIVNYRRQGTKDDGSVHVVDVTLDAVGSNQHPQQSRCKETLPHLEIQNNGHQADGIRGGNAPVLITGAAGFGGSHLVRELLNYGERVTGLDIVPASHAGLLGHELGHPNFRYVWKSLQDIEPSDVAGPGTSKRMRRFAMAKMTVARLPWVA